MLASLIGLLAGLLVAVGPAGAATEDPPTPTSEPPTDSTTSSEPTGSEPTTDPSATTPPPETTTEPAPEPPPEAPPAEETPFGDEIDAASQGQEALATEAMALSRQVLVLQDQLAQLQLQAEAAGETFRQAEEALAQAQAEADGRRQAAELAEADLELAEAALINFAQESYIDGNTQFARAALLVSDGGPRDLLDRMTLLDTLAESRNEVLARVLARDATSGTAAEEAETALAANTEAEARAREAMDSATALIESQQAQLPDLVKAQQDAQERLYGALVILLGPEGAAAAIADYDAEVVEQAAAEAAARAAANSGGPILSGAWALPTQGRLTSCFCQRWGTMHWGLDIAGPLYTPIYAPGDGVILRSGPASGFGQAIYLQHDNGDVTVFGHMEVLEVVTGQRVTAGQEIALMGSRGFSTGSHLHFEVYAGGMSGTRVDPVLWLAARGVYI